MKILITGSNGFVGRNLSSTLKAYDHVVYEFNADDTTEVLESYCKTCDIVFHFAGVNRSKNVHDFSVTNDQFTKDLCTTLKNANNCVPIVFTSTIHVNREDSYGQTKLAAELHLKKYSSDCQVPVYIFRLSNLFGKWSKPNYNSVIATWCYNIARDIPVEVHNPSQVITFEYIDDVIKEFMKIIDFKMPMNGDSYYNIPVKHSVTLQTLLDLLKKFKSLRENSMLPDLSNPFNQKLYSTYLSYLPIDELNYDLKTHSDNRGSFTEIFKSSYDGQISVNISKPGITKGQHWHHSKNEKFLVVSGTGCIQVRDIFSESIVSYDVSGNKLEIIEIPPGLTHNIINKGNTDLITLIWVNEHFDKEEPDTYYLEV